MNIVYRIIFSFCEGYNYLNGQVCGEFREIAPKVDSLEYLNQLLQDGKKPKTFVPSEHLISLALSRDLVSIIDACSNLVRKDIYKRAARYGSLKIMQWAKSKGYKFKDDICAEAAYYGSIEVMQWLRTQGCDWNEEVCANAAFNGHLTLL
nr:ankyrin repeat protein [Cedratvirus plubellavi]